MNQQRISATKAQHDRCFPGLRDEHGWRLQSHRMYDLLEARGLRSKGRFTVTEGSKLLVVGGTAVTVFGPYEARATSGKRGNRVHRVYAECQCCGKLIPFGRTHQHAKVH